MMEEDELKRLQKSFAASEGNQYWNNKKCKVIQENARRNRAKGRQVGGKKKRLTF